MNRRLFVKGISAALAAIGAGFSALPAGVRSRGLAVNEGATHRRLYRSYRLQREHDPLVATTRMVEATLTYDPTS